MNQIKYYLLMLTLLLAAACGRPSGRQASVSIDRIFIGQDDPSVASIEGVAEFSSATSPEEAAKHLQTSEGKMDITAGPDSSCVAFRVSGIARADKDKKVTIGLVGKYIRLHDAYLSVAEALHHAGYAYSAEVEIRWIDSEEITPENVGEILRGCDGILVPGGFGDRGIEGMITTAQYCREHKVPYLGICLGMQIAVIEFARHVCGIADANSGEFAPEGEHKVIDFLPDQNDEVDKGGTLRLGAYPCVLQEDTVIRHWYGEETIRERHRHRYEFNNDYRDLMAERGMILSGKSPDGVIVETVELPGQDFFVGVQFHPEFRSRPNRPHPLFLGLLHASISHGKKV